VCTDKCIAAHKRNTAGLARLFSGEQLTLIPADHRRYSRPNVTHKP